MPISLELTLLRLLKTRDKYEKLYRAIPEGVLEIKSQTVLKDMGQFFREFPDVQEIEPEPFFLWFKAFAHPGLDAEKQAFYKQQIGLISEDVSPELEAGLMNKLVAAATAKQLQTLIEAWDEGAEIDMGSNLRSIVEQFELDTSRKVKSVWVQDSIEDLLKEDENDTGFKWRQDEINLCMRPLRPGDFGILAARPDKGKTTLQTDAVTFFAPQVDLIYPGENRSILWFNNEGPGRRIISRLYQSALNCTISELVEKSKAGTVRQEYLAATGGRPDIIRVFDVHDFWNHEIEDIIRSTPPALIVFDMIDNVKFGGVASNNGQRTDQLLEAQYQWARVLAVKHGCPIIAASQISADGENLAYPSLSMLKDSKTGKQGAADFIMTVGALDDFPASRFLGLTKNKLARERGPRQPKIEVTFDATRGRYVPIGV